MGGNAEQLEAEHIYQWRKILQWDMCKYIKKKKKHWETHGFHCCR